MTTLKIEGMTCSHCVKSVAEALAKVPGVDEVVDVSLAQKEALVSGHADTAALVNAVADLGYEVAVA